MAAGTVIRGVSLSLAADQHLSERFFIFSQFLPNFVCFLPTFSTFCLDVAWIYLPKPKVQLKASAPGLTVFKLGRVWSVGAVGAGHNGAQTADTGSVCSVCCVRHLTGVGCFQDLNQILSSPPHLNWVTITTPHSISLLSHTNHKRWIVPRPRPHASEHFLFPLISFIYF